MTTQQIADELNRNKWYQKKDGSKITTFQIHGRTRNYSNIFNRDGSTVSLLGQTAVKQTTVSSVKTTTKVAATVKPTVTATSTDLTSLLKTFAQNLFDPLADLESSIADSPGNYILCLRPKSKLPYGARL